MEQKIWNKDNMIVEEFSGEFDDHNPVIGERRLFVYQYVQDIC